MIQRKTARELPQKAGISVRFPKCGPPWQAKYQRFRLAIMNEALRTGRVLVAAGDTQISEPAPTTAGKSEPLLAQAIAGDTVALERLLVPYQSRLLARFRRRMPMSLARVLAAEDLLQETFFEVVRSVQSFVPSGPHAFERWLITIADNR